jgi:septal ring factor EnvC (AmiA/AmiB activator)
MGEHRKETQKRLKAAEHDIKGWQAKVKADIDEMLDDLLRELLDRHNRLSEKHLDGGQSRDASLVGLANLEKEFKQVQKQISKSSVDKEVLTKSILRIAVGLGGIRKGLAGIEATLVKARADEPTPADLVKDTLAAFETASSEWAQSAEQFDAIYSELETTPPPAKLRGAEKAFDESRMDLYLARVDGDGSPQSIEEWQSHLSDVLGRKSTVSNGD